MNIPESLNLGGFNPCFGFSMNLAAVFGGWEQLYLALLCSEFGSRFWELKTALLCLQGLCYWLYFWGFLNDFWGLSFYVVATLW